MTEGTRVVGAETMHADAERAVLEARARELAVPIVATSAASGIEMVRFRRADAWYVIPIRQVLNVFRPAQMTRLPQAPWPAAALSAWRGDVLVVADFAAGRDDGFRRFGSVLVLGDTEAVVGLAADAVADVVRIEEGRIHESADNALIRGITDDLASVVDVAAILRMFARGES